MTVLAVRADATFILILVPLILFNSLLQCDVIATSRSALFVSTDSTDPKLVKASTANLHSLPSRAIGTSAWNGQVGAEGDGVDEISRAHFTPYYIPAGSRSIDDSDKNIQYSPEDAWGETRHPALVDKTMHTTSQVNAKAEIKFHGIGAYLSHKFDI